MANRKQLNATPTEVSASDPLKILTAINPSDIDARIEEIEQAIGVLGNEREGLRMIRRALDVRVNGKPVRKQRGNKPPRVKASSATGDETRIKDRIRQYLLARGPSKPAIIAADLSLDLRSVSVCLSTAHYFERFGTDGAFRVRKDCEE